MHLQLKNLPTREFFVKLVARLGKARAPYVFEIVQPHLGTKLHYTLTLEKHSSEKLFGDLLDLGFAPATDDHTALNHHGIHIMKYITPKEGGGTPPSVVLTALPAQWIGEGIALQYCVRPEKRDWQKVTLRLVTSANSITRSTDLMEHISAPFQSWFRLIKNTDSANATIEYTNRHHHEKHFCRLTNDELTNLLPSAI